MYLRELYIVGVTENQEKMCFQNVNLVQEWRSKGVVKKQDQSLWEPILRELQGRDEGLDPHSISNKKQRDGN